MRERGKQILKGRRREKWRKMQLVQIKKENQIKIRRKKEKIKYLEITGNGEKK